MMNAGWLLPMLTLIPVLCAGVCFALRSPRRILWFCATATLAVAVVAAFAAYRVFRVGAFSAPGNWFMLDALSAYHMVVMMLVFSLSSLFNISYFREEVERGEFTKKLARRYGGLWLGSLAAMMLVLVSNNIGVMWVGIEASTLLTAFLICIHATPGALEAMWKYLLMCSVGVAVAFIGTLLLVASTTSAALPGTQALLWTNLRAAAAGLNPDLLKAGFLFLVIGYGTKAGLAPMHNWLPDAHSQAPAPVSAIFSGFLLNSALYCILRCLPLVEAATGNAGWGRSILIAFGVLSILVAAIFIVAQRDVKRMLAYSSVEHLGIIALGVGLGGLGAVAALFHMLNHSLSKSVSFCCSGRLGQIYGTHDMRRMTGMIRTAPAWGAGLVIGLLTLIGVAPFAIFLSEFMILKTALNTGFYWVGGLFLAGVGVVFIGVLRNAISMAWEPLKDDVGRRETYRMESVLMFAPLAALLVLGIWVPHPFLRVLEQAANILGGAL
jgi:hydrogenase-4 component F